MQDISLPPGCTQAMVDNAYGRPLTDAESDALEWNRKIQGPLIALLAAIKDHDVADLYESLLEPLENAKMTDEQIIEAVWSEEED